MPTRVVNIRKEPYDIYIGRVATGICFGNPFTHRPSSLKSFYIPDENGQLKEVMVVQVETLEESIEIYEDWVVQQPGIMKLLPMLKNKTLGCFCAPKPCHGYVLARLADELE